MSNNSVQLIAKLRKNTREEIHVVLGEFNGKPIFNTRVFYDAGDGEMRPGKAGMGFKIDLLPDFADAVSLALEKARARGLVK